MTERPGNHDQRETPKTRPASDEELGFRRRAAVRWYHPSVLVDAGLRAVASWAFGAFLDKRELQDALDQQVFDEHAGKEELWIDYVADTGDGFPATYTTAWLTAQRQLRPEDCDRPLPRGDVLVFGGDEVYPVAGAAAYADRLAGPYEAALPWSRGSAPDLFAIPGNHDWYDGLTSFMRVFCQGRWIGGRRTCQARSYFALRLPHRWWLWGIDIAFDAYVDEPQMRYFARVARDEMQAGDRVILCTAKPSWVKPHDPGSYRNLAYVERKLLQRFAVPLTLAGDYHHYSRYVGADGSHKVTAGGGGAFLHPTHGLPDELVLPAHGDTEAAARVAGPGRVADPSEPASPVDPSEAGRRLSRNSVYPDVTTSRRLLWRCLALPVFNPRFLLFPGVLSAALLWAVLFALRAADPDASTLRDMASAAEFRDLATGLVTSPVAILVLAGLTSALIGFARPSARWPRPRRMPWVPKVLLGSAHALAHVLGFLAVAWTAVRLLSPALAGGLPVVVLVAVVALSGGVAGGLVMGGYLAVVNWLPGHAHGNEAFSALRLEDHKNFVRLHIDAAGALHLYAIGVDDVCRDWDFQPGSDDLEAPWLAPAGRGLRPRLIDGPVTIHTPGEG
ncbi:MAG TPA: hypothetical protein VM287_09950 [Egibacteraceae bacterium]|nr:hypothetical protein [Egibacteraceae bacterium]